MPAVNPFWKCQPCERGVHRWCTMESLCKCDNAFDGEGWRENIQRQQSREAVARLTKNLNTSKRSFRGQSPLLAGGGLWSCSDCGFTSPWWKGCERFKYCTECEKRRAEESRRELRESTEARGDGDRNDGRVAGEGQGRAVQTPLPLSAHWKR